MGLYLIRFLNLSKRVQHISPKIPQILPHVLENHLALWTSEAGIPAQLIQQMVHAKLIRRPKANFRQITHLF